MDIRELLEKMDDFAGQEVGQKPGDQVRGTERAKTGGKQHPFKGRLVGGSCEESVLPELDKASKERNVHREIGESWAKFQENMDDPAVESRTNYHANRTGFARGDRDSERHDLDVPAPQVWGLKINGKVWNKDGKDVTFNTREAALRIRDSILKNRPDLEIGLVTKGGQQGVAEDSLDEIDMNTVTHAINALNPVTGALAGAAIGKGIEKTVNYFQKKKQDKAYDNLKQQPKVAEGEQRVDSLVTDALKVMRGSDYQIDALKAIKTVLGDREYNGRRGYYNFYVRQLMDMSSQEGIAEELTPTANTTMAQTAGTTTPAAGATTTATPQDAAKSQQQQALAKRNLGALKTAGVDVDPAKAMPALQKAETGAPMNTTDQAAIAKMAPALGKILQGPQGQQLTNLVKSAGAMK
jgi:hypothetical protein